jgi:hypothetical protein
MQVSPLSSSLDRGLHVAEVTESEWWSSLQLVTEAFAETSALDPGGFTEASTCGTLVRACELAGFDDRGARLIRLGEHAMFRLAESVVVRIARTVAYEADARREVGVARWLESESYPAVRALDISQPLVVDSRVVTFWKSIADGEQFGTTAVWGARSLSGL